MLWSFCLAEVVCDVDCEVGTEARRRGWKGNGCEGLSLQVPSRQADNKRAWPCLFVSGTARVQALVLRAELSVGEKTGKGNIKVRPDPDPVYLSSRRGAATG